MNTKTALNIVPEAEGEVLEPHALAEVKHYRLEDEDGPGRAEDGERLPGQEAVGDANDEAGDEGLDSSDPFMYDRRNWSRMVTLLHTSCHGSHLFSVASPRSPPKVMMGVRHAK